MNKHSERQNDVRGNDWHSEPAGSDFAAFSLHNISIGFDGTPVLKDISFTLAHNEIHAIVGKNGAGKSTLMKVLTGIYTPDKGSITIFGAPIQPGESKQILQRGVSMVYQDLSLVPSMTVAQNIFLYSHPFQKFGLLQDAKAKNKAREIFAVMGIDFISPDAQVGSLSVGEAQLVEIAKALSNNPKIIVFDEPTASLSDVETAQLFKTVRTLRSRGMSIIYITHYLEDVMQLCDRITVLRDGAIASTARTADTSIPAIVGHMLGEEHTRREKNPLKTQVARELGTTPLLEVENAATAHLEAVSFCAYAGEIIGLAGLLGSGRTEILRMIYGLDALTGGGIYINGQLAKFSHPHGAAQHGIALVPEERRTQGLVLDFSLEHNLSLSILKELISTVLLNGAKRRALAKKSIDNLHIKAKNEKQAVRFLSGGNQQKVVFGKCLLSKPKILLLDDPTFGVDIHAKTEIMKIIENYAAEGNAVLFVSSELEEVASFCHRTYIIKKKRIAAEIGNENLSEKKLLQLVQ